jgi:hypothetical protein
VEHLLAQQVQHPDVGSGVQAQRPVGSGAAGLILSGAHYVKAFGTLAAEVPASSANREPNKAALFHATDDDVAEATAEQLMCCRVTRFSSASESSHAHLEECGVRAHSHVGADRSRRW